ncbi:MAG: hypothetical protein JW871_08120 [Endomicrobiales bacterium]|nr:hypothetical protein [Endomicrobiales bacterium]
MSKDRNNPKFNTPDLNTPNIPDFKLKDTPENIIKDLLQAEKDVATETLNVMKRRYEKERSNWEKIFIGKENEILSIRTKLTETEERLKNVQKIINEERMLQLEKLQLEAKDIENKKNYDNKKWNRISDEIKKFREDALIAGKRLLDEQNRVRQVKRLFTDKQNTLMEQIRAKEEEFHQFYETALKKEEGWLRAEAQRDEEISFLRGQVANLQETINEERKQQSNVLEKKDTDIGKLEQSNRDISDKLNNEVQVRMKLEEKVEQQKHRLNEVEEEKNKIRQEAEKTFLELKKTWQEEQSSWEKYKQDITSREQSLKAETEEQMVRILKSVEILEKQLAEEQKQRKDVEDSIKQKEEEIQRLLRQRDDIVSEWKNVLELEKQNYLKNQSYIISELNKIKESKDEEIAKLNVKANNLMAALSEEKKLFNIEKDKNKQESFKITNLEQEKQRLLEEIEKDKNEWQKILENEREFAQKQIEEVKIKSEMQLKSRDEEINRLNEDLRLSAGQLSELRQKFFVEKNENNTRLERIQELEIQLQQEKQKYDGIVDDLKKRLNSSIAALNKNSQDYLRNEQVWQQEKEKSMYSLKQDMNNLRDQLNKEISIRQALELKNSQLIQKNDELKSQKEISVSVLKAAIEYQNELKALYEDIIGQLKNKIEEKRKNNKKKKSKPDKNEKNFSLSKLISRKSDNNENNADNQKMKDSIVDLEKKLETLEENQRFFISKLKEIS